MYQRKPTGESEDTTGGFRVHTTRGPRFILKLVLSALRVKMEESKLLHEPEIRSVEGPQTQVRRRAASRRSVLLGRESSEAHGGNPP